MLITSLITILKVSCTGCSTFHFNGETSNKLTFATEMNYELSPYTCSSLCRQIFSLKNKYNIIYANVLYLENNDINILVYSSWCFSTSQFIGVYLTALTTENHCISLKSTRQCVPLRVSNIML